MSKVFQTQPQEHCHSSLAEGDQRHLGQRMRGDFGGARSEWVGMSTAGAMKVSGSEGQSEGRGVGREGGRSMRRV